MIPSGKSSKCVYSDLLVDPVTFDFHIFYLPFVNNHNEPNQIYSAKSSINADKNSTTALMADYQKPLRCAVFSYLMQK